LSAQMDITPSFARDASAHLDNRNVQLALDLCLRGTKQFPSYATGHLVLGKCYVELGRTSEALAEFRLALGILPDNPEVRSLVKKAQEKEQKEFMAQVAEQEKRYEVTAEVIEIPRQPEPPPKKEETAVDYLEKVARDLQSKNRIKPNPPSAQEPQASKSEGSNVQFVTPTLAEIYARQGEYDEAINAYRELQTLHPGEKESFATRIVQLEELRAIQQREKNIGRPAKQ
jgi:tetratricopeptide (TPR) repeat protein